MKVHVYVTLKNGVLDPQGDAVKKALHTMGFSTIQSVRQGKFFEIDLKDSTKDPEQVVRHLCEELLANMVIEDFRFEIKG